MGGLKPGRVVVYAASVVCAAAVMLGLQPAPALADMGIPPGYLVQVGGAVPVLAVTLVVAAVAVPAFLGLRKMAESTRSESARQDRAGNGGRD